MVILVKLRELAIIERNCRKGYLLSVELIPFRHMSKQHPHVFNNLGGSISKSYISSKMNTVFARSVAAATNVFSLSRREATIQERLLFESGVYLFDCALPQELNDYVMVFVNV